MKKLQRKSGGKLISRSHDTFIILCSYMLGFRPSEPQAMRPIRFVKSQSLEFQNSRISEGEEYNT